MNRFQTLGVSLTLVVATTTQVLAQAPQPGGVRLARPAETPAPAGASSTAPAAGQAARPKLDPQVSKQRMETLLAEWERRSAGRSTLDVSFSRLDVSVAWNQNEEFRGKAYFQSPNLACLHTQKVVKEEGKPPRLEDDERIVCSGKSVFQYDYAAKEMFIFPLARDQRKRAIEEGPLPFLFDMRAEAAQRRYVMTYLDEDESVYLINVVPRLQDDREVFSKAYIYLNKETFLPNRLLLLSPNGKDTQKYQFTSITPNVKISPEYFEGKFVKGWKVIDNPAPDQAARRTPARRDPAPGKAVPSKAAGIPLPGRTQR